jgi:hypothetical protein
MSPLSIVAEEWLRTLVNIAHNDSMTNVGFDFPSKVGGADQSTGSGERSRTMIIIGVDFHPEFQQIALVNTETGELRELRLNHPNEAAGPLRGAFRLKVGSFALPSPTMMSPTSPIINSCWLPSSYVRFQPNRLL